ncbi:hypothetical protein SAMN05216227_102725 [Pseudorhodobacter antarcticus]|jgi:hypothetical protein|uniref:Uncharacterized protein n=1 Tax=Pseudorhodobacter antarcticus TaxID=1077947 RepID=A0A1H8JVB0_9RHOB|nr:hypothetical protein [Pseudorhodobacter antarcticus]SEN84307.1 hypothetical protein SAMN05216227_102725 [Pseudorhodobacter antarcticus]
MNYIWFLRMARWVRNPPSPQMVKLVIGVIAVSLLIFGFEYMFGWPEWLTPNGGGRAHRLP